VTEFRAETLVAVEAVEAALGLARARAGADEVTLKGVRDVVTATDLAAEDAIRRSIGERLGIPVVGEEAGGDRSGSSYWLVDPICGTRNYASRIPLYCVNVALVESGHVTIGVVGDPSGEILVAERGRGAWADSEPLLMMRPPRGS
jgi:myo-inositol-1(or 4)-monophosphatase